MTLIIGRDSMINNCTTIDVEKQESRQETKAYFYENSKDNVNFNLTIIHVMTGLYPGHIQLDGEHFTM